MTKPHLPQCPYCGRKLHYPAAFSLRREGEYRCRQCGGISNVKLSKRLYALAAACILIAVGFVVGGAYLLETVNVLVLVGTFAPFIVFYIAAPFFVELAEPVLHRRPVPQKAPAPRRPVAQAPTRQMPLPAQRPPQTAPAVQEPTKRLEVASMPPPLDDAARLEQALSELASLQVPVFYEKPEAAEPEGTYGAYRSPLRRVGQAPSRPAP